MLVYLPKDAKRTTASTPTGRRSAPRLRVYIPGKLVMLGGTYKCGLEDISQTGAKVLCEADIAKGATGVLQCMEIDVLCKVIRARKGQFGLHFEEYVSVEAIEQLRRHNDICKRNDAREVRVHAKRWATGQYA